MPPNDNPYATPPAPLPVAPPSPPPTDPGPGLPAPVPAAPTAPAAPNGDPAAPSAPTIDADAIQTAVETALGPVQTELAALRAENASLRDGQAPTVPAPAAGETDFTQDLLTDPRGAVTSIVKEVVGSLAPFLNELSGTAHEAIIEGHRGIIDNEFGTNTFQEEFMPVLEKRFEVARRDNPTLLASREWINSEVNGIKGFKLNNLVERRGKASEARTEAEKAQAERLLTQFNATNLTGGLRPSASKSREPTPDEQAYLKARAESGQPLELEVLRKSQEAGSSLSSLQAAFKKEDN